MAGASPDQKSNTEPPVRAMIMVVGDEVLLRALLADELRAAGYAVVEAADVQEALCALSHTSDVKVIITDIQMPDLIDGIMLARVVRSQHPTIKLVLTSGYYPAIDGLEHDGFFPKPYDPGRIIAHVGTLLD
jgi:CheY-like chemotaxis protein